MREQWMVPLAGAHGVGAAIYFGAIGRINLMALWALFAILAFVTAAGYRAARVGLMTLAAVGIPGHLAAGAVFALTLVMHAMGGSSERFAAVLLALAWCAWAIVMLGVAIIGALGHGGRPRQDVTPP